MLGCLGDYLMGHDFINQKKKSECAQGLALATQVYIERSSSARITALHYGLAHK